MTDELEQEDLSALRVLEDIGHGAGQEDTEPVDLPAADEASEVLRRLYVEGLGLLAYDLLPAQPLPGTRATLLAHLIGDETQEVSPLLIGASHGIYAPAPAPRGASAAPESSDRSAPSGRPGVLVSQASKAEPAIPAEPKSRAELGAPPAASSPSSVAPVAPIAPIAPREAQARQSTRRSRWPAVLATLFALSAAGLGVWAAMLLSEISYRDSQIRGLSERLTELPRLAGELEVARADLAALEQRHAFVTAPATTVFLLRTPAAGSLQPNARGHLYLAPDRRHWQLEVRGLKPEPEPQDYQLWFIVDGLPLSGGVFDVRAGKTAVLADSSLPARSTAIVITLERKGGTASPTSPILLASEGSVQL